MICVVQYNKETCVICTGVALPAAIVVAWNVSWKLSIQDMYTKHIKLTQSKKKLVSTVFSTIYVSTRDL